MNIKCTAGLYLQLPLHPCLVQFSVSCCWRCFSSSLFSLLSSLFSLPRHKYISSLKSNHSFHLLLLTHTLLTHTLLTHTLLTHTLLTQKVDMSSMLSVVLKDLWHKDQNAWGCSQVRLSVFCPVIEERISSLTKVYCLLRPFFFFCFFLFFLFFFVLFVCCFFYSPLLFYYFFY